ncbi:MAG: histidine kinase dimerization/phospho-acceptor domain-containing protein, partial [Bacteroidota bacterium]
MITACISTLGFGTFYLISGVKEVYQTSYGAFILFAIFGVLSFFIKNKLVTLFRLSVLLTALAFYIQIYFTGGINSPALFEFIIPPLLAFFYRPVIDRYVFMGVSFTALISFWLLTKYGYTQDLLPQEYRIIHAFICGLFVFLIVGIYTVLFRWALIVKNRQIGDSMKQLQETTQKLIQSEKMASLGVLSAGVAHEINNPLNFIRGGIEVMEKGIKEEGKKFEIDPYIHVIKEGLERAATIVNSLSHFSRQTQSMDEPCDLHDVLNNSIVMLQPKLKYKGEVKKAYDKSSAVILGNEGKLHQAFLNIISNAEQAIDENGVITIKTLVTEKRITVEISDTGVGISKENLNKISDPFFTTKPVG